ncbi:hypothetical protein ANCCEY_09332 [Ancylostoma ceylanicum]|uniref:Polycystin domain-containing protein n=1 Tax=Ancylostoma ceylanicum TaxID=53326 RepID=A0A0D6LHW6_9BILA|nr:hypothetical protein ANCCEY_09332 [Ancylostoma ceylanicum]
MREVACLLASLVVIMGLVFYYRDNTGFLYQQQVRSLLNLEQIPYGPVAFGSINQIEQFWTWANDSLAPALLASWYDGGPAWAMRGFANDKVWCRSSDATQVLKSCSIAGFTCNGHWTHSTDTVRAVVAVLHCAAARCVLRQLHQRHHLWLIVDSAKALRLEAFDLISIIFKIAARYEILA